MYICTCNFLNAYVFNSRVHSHACSCISPSEEKKNAPLLLFFLHLRLLMMLTHDGICYDMGENVLLHCRNSDMFSLCANSQIPRIHSFI